MKDALMIINSISFIAIVTSYSSLSSIQSSQLLRDSIALFIISFIAMIYADEESMGCKKEIENLIQKKKTLTIN